MTISDMKVGTQVVADGTITEMRGTKDGSQAVQDSHAKYQEAVYRGNVFIASNQALATLQTGLTTIQTGLGLYNPVQSGKILVIWRASCVFTLAQPTASAVVGLLLATNTLQAAPTSQTVATYRNALAGSNTAPSAIPLVAGTLAAAPVFGPVMGLRNTGAITVDTQPGAIKEWFDGAIQVYPGAYVGFGISIAPAATSFWGDIIWEEIAV